MRSRWLARALWAAVGLIWFVWLGYEDRGLTVVLAIGVLLSAALSPTLWRQWFSATMGGRRLLAALVVGAILGAAAPLLAILLIFLKVSLHNHPVADFTMGEVRQLLAVVPVWSLVGLLAGAAFGLAFPPRAASVASAPAVAYNEPDEGTVEVGNEDGSR